MDYDVNNDCNDFLIDFYLKENENNITKGKFWNKYIVHINYRDGETLLIETEKNHWVFINKAGKLVNYVDPCGNEIPDYINEYAESNNLKLKRKLWGDCLINLNPSDCLKYSLYVNRQIIKANSQADVEDIINNKKEIEMFTEDFRSCKSQFKKIIEKVEVCSDLFRTFIKDMPAITDYKHALHFTYFLESIALQDTELNAELKKYVINKIGSTNVDLVKKIRIWLLHREKYYFIFPQQLHKFSLRENNSRIIFEHLQKFLENVHKKLCGKQVDISEINLETFLFHSEELGNKIDKEEVNIILEDLSSEFIEEVFSLKRAKKPEKTLFNFTVNFIPLLRVLYGNIKQFEMLINFRNHLIHNIYALYQSGSEVPYITFQNMLNDVRGFLLRFNLCSRVSRELKNISESDVKRTKEIIGACLEKFKEQFSEEIRPQPPLDSDIDLQYLIRKINLYFKSLLIVDLSNKITVKNMPIEKFELPKFCYRFSEEKRNAIFQIVNVIKEIKQSSDLSEDCCKTVEKSLKEDLDSFGLENSEYELILKSVLDSRYFDNKKAANEIFTHISNIMKLKQNSKFDLTTIINDYHMYLENNPNFNYKKYKNILVLKRFIDQTFEINIPIGSFYINLSNLINNFIPLYFNLFPNYEIFQKLESTFQDREVVELISCNMSTSFELQIFSLPFLAPLGVELLCNQKIKLENAEKIDFIKYLTWHLLKYENGNYFLNCLFSMKMKESAFDFPNECLEMVKQMKLIKENPNKVHFLFSNLDIQKKLLSILKSTDLNAYSKLILKRFLNYLYESTYELYEMGNYNKALDLVDKKNTGLSSILKEADKRNLGCSEMRKIEIKFLFAKIKFQMAVKENSNDYFNASLRILNKILSSLSNSTYSEITKLGWELRIKSLKARISHYLGKCKESCDQYKEIFLKLYGLNDATIAENEEELFDKNGFISRRNEDLKREIKQLLKTEKYIFAVKYSNRNINIFQVIISHAKERFCQIRFLESEKEKTLLFEEFLKYLKFFFIFKKQILGKNVDPYLDSKFTIKEIEKLLSKYEMDSLLEKILSQAHFTYPVAKRRSKR
ncbi:UNVERIFIED_CONTAM: hypothetical protein RMT77_014664 [Armadillidium vulgare]